MNEIKDSTIGERIKLLRKKRGYNQKELANLLGKSLRTIQKYESGEIEVSIAMINELAKVLDTTSTYLLGHQTGDFKFDCLSDVMECLFQLEKISGLHFSIETKRPPHHDGWQCSITFDGKELRDISSESLYDIISVIQQNVFVFNASIRDNVTMFRNFPDEEVDSAILHAHLSELIEKRGDGYLCGENGKGLSGGEKQRISIARSLLKKSSVLLADEITAALDAQTARQVSSDILSLEGITRIVITHALDEALLRRYDGILVMKNGRIEERGTFDELMAKKGYFYALYTVG